MSGPRHGTTSNYRKGCRCEDCTLAKRGRYDTTTDSDALTGGQWVPLDGIMRWQSDLTTTTTTRQEA